MNARFFLVMRLYSLPPVKFGYVCTKICGPDAVVTVPRKKGKCLVGPGSVGRYGNLEIQFQMVRGAWCVADVSLGVIIVLF